MWKVVKYVSHVKCKERQRETETETEESCNFGELLPDETYERIQNYLNLKSLQNDEHIWIIKLS